MNVNKGLLAILATAALAAAKNAKKGSNAKKSGLAYDLTSKMDFLGYYGFKKRLVNEEHKEYLIYPLLASMGKTLGFDENTVENVRLYEEDAIAGRECEVFSKEEYNEVQDSLSEIMLRFFTAEISYYLENDTPIVSEFIRISLSSSEPFIKGKMITQGKIQKHSSMTRLEKGGGVVEHDADHYLPIYQRLPKQMQSKAGEQEFIRKLAAGIGYDTSGEAEQRSGYLRMLMQQMKNLITVKIATLLMVPAEQISHLGDANFENPNDFFATKSLYFNRLKNLLIKAKRTGGKEFSYLTMINEDGSGDLYRATTTSYKIRTHRKSIQTLVISTGNFQNRLLDYVQIPDSIISGVEANENQWGVLEKIRYSKDYQKNPNAFSLYVRSILGLRQTLSLKDNNKGIDVYALKPNTNGDQSLGLEAIQLDTDPFRFDPVTGDFSLAIRQWADNSIQKMISLKENLFQKKDEFIRLEVELGKSFYCTQVSETLSSFLDMPLYNKIILSWKNNGNRMNSSILDDLHLLVIGFLYRINRNFYEAADTPLTISAICDAYCNPLIPFGTATVASYNQALKMCISGMGIPTYISADCVEEDYVTDGLGFLVDRVCYDVATSNTMIYLVSEDTISDARNLYPYFTFRYFEQGSCLISYNGPQGSQTVLMHKSFPLHQKAGLIRSQAVGAAVAIAPQVVTANLDDYDLCYSLVNAFDINKTQWAAEKVFGYFMDIKAKPYFKKEDFSLLGTRLRVLGYWFSRVSIHLYRTLKSSQRSLSWYLMSTIISPDAIDIGVEKYVNSGLIDPQIVPQIAGRRLEDKSWEELSQNKYFNSVSLFKKFQATLRMILKRVSSYSQLKIKEFQKFNFNPINGNAADPAWLKIVNDYMIVSENSMSADKVSSFGVDIGDAFFLNSLKSKIRESQNKSKNHFISLSSTVFKRRGLTVNVPNNASLDQKLEVYIRQANALIGLGAKAQKALSEVIFNIEKRSPLVSILHKDSIQLFPKPIVIDDQNNTLEGYSPVFFGRKFREPYVKFTGLDEKSKPTFDGMVQVWEDGRIVQQVVVAGQQAPNPNCELRMRVKTPEGTLLAGQKFGMYGENEKNFASHYSDAKDDFRNLSLLNQIFTDVAKRMGYIDNGDHDDPRNINALTLEQFLRAVGFYGDPSYNLEKIISTVSESREAVEDQLISFFKLNKVPFVKGSSLTAYKAFLREANGKPVHEAEEALKNLALTIGIPLFPYIEVSGEKNVHQNEYIYGQYNLIKQQKTVINNYNNEYVPTIANQNNEFMQQRNSKGIRQQQTAFVQIQQVQNDYHSFREGIDILSCQVYFTTLSELMRQMGQTQLDSFGAVGEAGMPIYLKVREQRGGSLGILNDDPMGFATMYQVLADHGQILEAGDRKVIAKVANPSKVLASALAGAKMSLDAEDIKVITDLLSNTNFKNIAQYPTWNEEDKVVNWNGIDNKIDRVIIEIAGPLSNHQTKISQANKWSKSANEIDKGKSKAYWDKYERLSKNILENKEALQSLLDIKELAASKLPELNLEIFDWKGLVSYPDALVKFRNYLLEDIKGFMSFPGEISDQVFTQQAASYQQALERRSISHQQAFRKILEQQASKRDGMGIRSNTYKERTKKIYDSYLDAFNISIVRLESERLGPLAFITPSGYRVYTPVETEQLRWISRSSIPSSETRTWDEHGVDSSIAHFTAKLPADIVPQPNGTPTRVCIGWSSQGYANSLKAGTQIHFVALDPSGKFTMLMSFNLDKATGNWNLSQAVYNNDSSFLTRMYTGLGSDAEKSNMITLGREFLSGAREWSKAPTSDGPEELSSSWKKSSELLWKKNVPIYLGTDAQIATGDSPMLSRAGGAFSGLVTPFSMGIPYTTSLDGSIKK